MQPLTGDSVLLQQPDLDSLAIAAGKGAAEAAERLYHEARPRLLRMALALGVPPEDAADLTQETLWAAHRQLGRYDPARASFMGWLATILARRARNRRRDRARRFRFLERLRGSSPRADAGRGPAVEARLTLSRLLAGLTERQREVVSLYELGELSAAEVATALDISEAGVRSIARDARRKLAAAADRSTTGRQP